jgi:hypothetical protein
MRTWFRLSVACFFVICLLGLSGCNTPIIGLALPPVDKEHKFEQGSSFTVIVSLSSIRGVKSVSVHPTSPVSSMGIDTGITCEPKDTPPINYSWVCKIAEGAKPDIINIRAVAILGGKRTAVANEMITIAPASSPAAKLTTMPTATTANTPAATLPPSSTDIITVTITDTPAQVVTEPPSAGKFIVNWDNGNFETAYVFGEDNAIHSHDWVHNAPNNIGECMNYRPALGWATVFFTVGIPKDDAHWQDREIEDMSQYKTVSIELKGAVDGEKVAVGIKDKEDPSNGSEKKIELPREGDPAMATTWQTYTVSLSDFTGAELTQLNNVLELVFEPGSPEQTVCFRNVQYLP